MRNIPITKLAIVGILTAGSLLADRVQAQNALGGGNALDSNLSPYSGGYNTPTPVHDFRIGNDIVTGNVAGGRGFRDFVGYRASDDFRGNLGTNDLFRFRADSALSNPALYNLGRTFDQIRFGETMGLVEVRRSGAGASGETLSQQGPYGDLQLNSARLRLDRSLVLGASIVNTETSIEPRTIGMGADRETGSPLLMQVSPLRGLTTTLPEQSFNTLGLTTLDQLHLREDREAGRVVRTPGTRLETRFDTRTADVRVTDTAAETGLVPADPNAQYQKILDSIVSRYADERDIDLKNNPDKLVGLNEQYRLLRERLLGERKPQREAASDDEIDTRRTTEIDDRTRQPSTIDRPTGPDGRGLERPAQPEGPGSDLEAPGSKRIPTRDDLTALPPLDSESGLPTRRPKPSTGEPQPPQPGLPDEPEPFDPSVYGPILRHGQKVPTLTEQDKGRMSELLAEAEQRLHNGDYFSAERRFERALRFVPDHPLATAGIAHSQIGAGLYLSAALTLRNLFAEYPEMIDVTYGETALPPRIRLNEVVTLVRKYLRDPERDQSGYGFLLAYLGRQLGDREMIGEGLKVFKEAEPSAALPPLLESIWLADPAAKSGSPEKPAAPTSPPPAESPNK